MRQEIPGLQLYAAQAAAWAGFLFLWVRLSLKDWRERKILHRDLRAATAFVAAAYAILAASTLFGALGWSTRSYRWEFYRDLIGHLALSCAAALGLWGGRIWPAGDAKLFMFLAALLPLLSISGSFAGGGLFFQALVNVFLPACAFVLAQVAVYFWQTRLRHGLRHFAAMGPRRAADFAVETLFPALRAALRRARGDVWAFVRSPRALAEAAASWTGAILLMALLSTFLKEVIPSPSMRTLLGFLIMIGWSRTVSQLGGQLWQTALSAVAAGAAWALATPAWQRQFMDSVAQISVFGLCMMAVIRWTLGSAFGTVFMLLMPLLLGLAGTVASALGSRVPSQAGELLRLALLGSFFGLCYVLTRVWEDEDKPEIALRNLRSYMVVHPSFLSRLRAEDEGFYEDHFGSSYADGLTERQVRAVRGWCERRGVATVPLQNTMSFAHWIFLGYFLTWLMGGHVLERFL